MKTILRQAIGIDCSKDKLDCCYGQLGSDFTMDLHAPVVFANTIVGFNKLLDWANKRLVDDLPVMFVMEATGVYHEQLASFLADQNCAVSVVLPNRISNFMRTTATKTITDKIAAQIITQFALEKKLDKWQKPNRSFLLLKQLTRERAQLIADRTVVSNQLHAEKHSAWASPSSIKRMDAHIQFISKQIKEIEAELSTFINKESALKTGIENVCTIPGVNVLTVATVLGETNGFELIRNKKQLVSYAGLDVIEKESGTSVKSRPRISKKGNRHLRKALYFPAFSSVRFNADMSSHYAKLVAKHGVKMKAAVSVQRKLLVLIYTLWKRNTPFVKEYGKKESGQQLLATPTELDQIRPE